MKLFLKSLTFLLGILIESGAATTESYKILKFGSTTADYVSFTPDMQPFTEAFSVCSWIRKLSELEYPTWFSYAVSGSYNELWMTDDGYYQMLGGYDADLRSQAGVRTGVWYHYCMCWDFISSTADTYHNGRKTGSRSTTSGRRLTSNGNLVLGQDQDTVGGSFDSDQAFGGELQKLNMFSKKLSSSEVNEMYSAGRCSDTVKKTHGDYRQLKWEDILQQTRTGNVSVVDTCTDRPEYQLLIVRRQLEEANEELRKIREELMETKTSKDELSEELNRTKSDLEERTSEVEELEVSLETTTDQLTRMETQLDKTETVLTETEKRLNNTETLLTETETRLNNTETLLTETETRLNNTEILLTETEKRLNNTETLLTETETRLNNTETLLTETETRLNNTETLLTETETRLNNTETVLTETETRLNNTETVLTETETRLNNRETLLTETQNDLTDTADRLNRTQIAVQRKDAEVEELEATISGHNCYRVTNSTHWDILYTPNFYNEVITDELLDILNNSWEKLRKFGD